MFHFIRSVLARNADTLVADAAGCAALVVVLYIGLMLPGLV